MLALAMALAAGLPSVEECRAVPGDPEAALTLSVGLQGYIYG